MRSPTVTVKRIIVPSMPTYQRQVETEQIARDEIAAIRAAGRWASEPVRVYSPNGRLIWGYSAQA